MVTRRGATKMALFSWFMSWFGAAKATEPKFRRIEDLRAIVVKRLQETTRSVEALALDKLDPAKFSFVLDGTQVEANVSNIFGYINNFPEENESELIEKYLRSFLSVIAPPVENLVTLIRTTEYVANFKEGDAIFEAIAGELVKIVMIDLPESMITVGMDKFDGKSASELLALGTANVAKSLPELIFDQSLSPIVLCYVEGNAMLTSGLLLTEEFWLEIGRRVSEDVLVAIPRRDQVFLLDARQVDAVAAMKKLIAATFEDRFNLVSDGLYRHRNGNLAVADL